MKHYDDYLDAIYNVEVKIEAMENGEMDDFYLGEAKEELEEAKAAKAEFLAFDAEHHKNQDDLQDAEKLKWDAIGVVGACLDFGHNEQLDELHKATAADVRCLSNALDVYADALEIVRDIKSRMEGN